jgi:hypothetical protein
MSIYMNLERLMMEKNYPEQQEYVLIGSQEDYHMECLRGRCRGEDDSKKHLDGNCQPEETTKNDEEDKNQQQQKPVVARNNEDNNMEYLRTREARVDDPSRLHQVYLPQQTENIHRLVIKSRKICTLASPGYKVFRLHRRFQSPIM